MFCDSGILTVRVERRGKKHNTNKIFTYKSSVRLIPFYWEWTNGSWLFCLVCSFSFLLVLSMFSRLHSLLSFISIYLYSILAISLNSPSISWMLCCVFFCSSVVICFRKIPKIVWFAFYYPLKRYPKRRLVVVGGPVHSSYIFLGVVRFSATINKEIEDENIFGSL